MFMFVSPAKAESDSSQNSNTFCLGELTDFLAVKLFYFYRCYIFVTDDKC